MVRVLLFLSVRFVLSFLFLQIICSAHAQPVSNQERVEACFSFVQQNHYKAPPIDDAFSAVVFDKTLELLDEDGFYLSQEDVKKLSLHSTTIDNELTSGNYTFFKELTTIYKQRVAFAQSVLGNINLQQINFSANEVYTVAKKTTYLPESALNNHWERRLKVRVLNDYFNELDSTFIESGKTDEALLDSLKRINLEQLKCKLNTSFPDETAIEEKVLLSYLNAVCYGFDPHTQYFTPEKKEQFENYLSKTSSSFGLDLVKNDKGEIEIDYVLPGGPAWSSQKINEGDVILGLTTSKGEKITVNCENLQSFVEAVYSETHSKCTFHIKKLNGQVENVSLEKEDVEVEKNVIQSFILGDEVKVGYVYLPSFYAGDLGSSYLSNGCANDLAKEVLKLKREGIEGFVLDLRDNGGGSMLEAIRLAGSFIDFGAVSISDDKNQALTTLKDMSRGVIFNKPLILLVNDFSASASELLAASLQDQNRALIVGSSTYGKSTSQGIYPLGKEELGYVKLTSGAFYRVTGKTHQGTGVAPDITLPNVYAKLGFKEAAAVSALHLDPVSKKVYYYPADTLPVNVLRTKSELRITKNAQFTKIPSLNIRLKEQIERQAIPLDLKGYQEYFYSDSVFDEIDSLQTEDGLTVNNSAYLFGMSELGDNQNEVNKDIMDEISTDIYINEAYKIMLDWLNLND